MKQIQIYIIWLALLVFMLGACSSETQDESPISEEQEESAEVRPEVIFAVTDDEPIYYYVESKGVVEANREILLKPKINGFVAQSNIIEGAHFQKGDTLLSFIDDEWELAVQEARNEYQQALNKYQIETKLRQGDRDTLGTNGTKDESDEMVRITTGLAQAELALDRAKLNLSYATMEAPFSGRLAAENRIEPGSYVNAGMELGTLISDRTVRIRFDVLESEVGRIKAGMTTQLTAPDGSSISGRVSAVSPMVDSESKTGEVIVKADNTSGILRPGMTIEGRIQVEKLTDKVRIPRSAVLERDGGRTLVFKLHPGKEEVEWIYVTPKFQNSQWTLLDHPNIEPGDTLAVDKHFALSHLQKVEPKMQLLQRKEGDTER